MYISITGYQSQSWIPKLGRFSSGLWFLTFANNIAMSSREYIRISTVPGCCVMLWKSVKTTYTLPMIALTAQSRAPRAVTILYYIVFEHAKDPWFWDIFRPYCFRSNAKWHQIPATPATLSRKVTDCVQQMHVEPRPWDYHYHDLLHPFGHHEKMGVAPSKTFKPLEELPSLKGKVVIVTGSRSANLLWNHKTIYWLILSSSGIGFASLQHLLRLGAKACAVWGQSMLSGPDVAKRSTWQLQIKTKRRKLLSA